jgi:hypothetical protein
MSKFLAGLAALTLAGAAMMPIRASAAEATSSATKSGVTTSKAVQSTEISAQRRHYRHRYGYYGPRRYYAPRYRYYRPYPYYGYGYPYRYYRPAPAVTFGFGPFGFGVF